MLINTGNFNKVDNFLAVNHFFNDTIKYEYKLALQILSFNQKTNTKINNSKNINTKKYKSLVKISYNLQATKYKNPYLSMTMSAIIPGSGKIYTGYYKDGIIALLLIASNGFYAYRRFNKEGINSVYGWIWASISTGFYFGNIYGSFKATKKHNKNIIRGFKKKAINIITD